MNEHMVKSWNDVVTDNDVVYHLGDFSFGDFSVSEKMFNRLKGQKHLIEGNHEKNGIKHSWLSINKYREVKVDGKNIILFHFPIEEWNGLFHGSFHFHGHVHSTKSKPYREIKNRFDVGVDNIGFRPLTFKEIVEYV